MASMVVDEEVLYHPQKSRNYLCYLRCVGTCQAAGSLCFCPACLLANEIFEQSDTFLSQDGVHVNTVENDCCCHLASRQITIPFDKITDVQLNSNCCFDLFGVHLLEIQTAGAPIAEGRILFVDDVETYREKILEMKRNPGSGGVSAFSGGGPKGMLMKEENVQSMSPIQKIRTLKEFADLGILTQQEYETLSQKVMMSDEFQEQKRRLIDQF
jgi:hypothetical protein